ncbi:MAG: aminodeoxychorismate lyase [Corynebacterium sp.]|nr:aminodeoxychorismate lyase [Corynebacterium sp.]
MAEAKRIVVNIDAAGPRLHEATAPLLYADDLAALRGDGIFETLLLRAGYVRNQQPHFERFLRSAVQLDLPSPDQEVWEEATKLAAAEFQAQVGEVDAAVRWNYSRGRENTGQTTAWISVTALPATYIQDREQGIRVLSGPRGFRRDIGQRAPWALAGAKTLSYAVNMAALRYAKDHDADDMIFLDDANYVLEGPTSTVVVVRGNTLLTPPPSAGILHGTTQLKLFEAATAAGWEIAEADLQLADLFEHEGLYLLSSGRLATWVRNLDGTNFARPSRDAEIQQLCAKAIAE